MIIGTLVEGTILALGVEFGRFGMCDPTNEAAGILLLLHRPGLSIASLFFPKGGSPAVVAALTLSVTMWSLAAFLCISSAKLLRHLLRRPVAEPTGYSGPRDDTSTP
jgi:hypothetical protein